MSPPETRTNISPKQMHRNIVSAYKELPPKANLAKALGLVAAIVAGYYLVLLPITSELGEFGETINIFGFMFAAAAVYGAVANYFTQRNNRQLEVQHRAKVKGEYDRMHTWYAGEEQVHRNATKNKAGQSAYPVDWATRKKYVRTRDGACYLCKGSRDNDRYYFYKARDGR
ncbi:hypothetical protein EOL96_06645, partial [Candidatus Saccharibacteria bacterium]|nr:hypothetical protein [Candidatus Saccharibacteria bacterium]